jgi:hypothetical protein
VEEIRLSDTGVTIRLTSGAAESAKIGQDVEIELTPERSDSVPLREAVGKFQTRLLSWGAQKAERA